MCKRFHLKRKTTILDIARELKTAPSTVSRALNGNRRISEETRKEVARVAKRLGYMRNHFASSLRSGKSNVIGVVVPFTDSSFFSSIIRGVEDIVNREGYNVMICQSHDIYEREVKCVEALLEAGVAAIAISVSSEVGNYKHIEKASELGMPLILFDRVVEELDTYSVMIDDYRGAYEAVTHLVSMGYRKVALFIGNREINIFRERYRGYKEAMAHHNLSWNEDYILEVDSSVEAGEAAAKKLLELSDPPDAILSSSDFSALGAMQFLQNRVNIPEEIGIIGFSNEPFTGYVSPSLSTVDQQSQKMGEVVGRSFIELQGENLKQSYPVKTLLRPELIIRESTRRI